MKKKKVINLNDRRIKKAAMLKIKALSAAVRELEKREKEDGPENEGV